MTKTPPSIPLPLVAHPRHTPARDRTFLEGWLLWRSIFLFFMCLTHPCPSSKLQFFRHHSGCWTKGGGEPPPSTIYTRTNATTTRSAANIRHHNEVTVRPPPCPTPAPLLTSPTVGIRLFGTTVPMVDDFLFCMLLRCLSSVSNLHPFLGEGWIKGGVPCP